MLQFFTSPAYSIVVSAALFFALAYAVFLRLRIKENQKIKKAIRALANTYVSICYVDIQSNKFEEIYSADFVRDLIGKKGNPQDARKKTVFDGFVMESYISRMAEFTDLKTLEERLKGKAIISQEYEGPKLGWCRASFVPVEYDKACKLKSVLYNVQVIQGEILSLCDKLNLEETLLESVLALSKSTDGESSIERLLANVASYHHADRAYVFEFDNVNETVSNTYEWCQKDVPPQAQKIQNMKIDNVFEFMDLLEQGVVNIGDVNVFEKDSALYKLLEEQNVKSLMCAPLMKNKKLIGFVGVDNPHFNQEMETVLISVTSFIITELEKKQFIKELYDLSYKDKMTGVFNRHANMRDVDELAAQNLQNIGIVYGDVNGLKEANDKFNHEHGDRLIISAADMLKKYYGREDDKIYRMGGDEFVVICKNVQEDLFNQNYENMKNELGPDYILSTGKSWLSSCDNINEHIKTAEHEMYVSKRNYYQTHDRRRNRV